MPILQIAPFRTDLMQPFALPAEFFACLFSGRSVYTVTLVSREEGEERQRDLGVGAETLRTDILQVAEGHEGIRRELQEMRKLTDKSASHLC